jgi:hypothetical protein
LCAHAARPRLPERKAEKDLSGSRLALRRFGALVTTARNLLTDRAPAPNTALCARYSCVPSRLGSLKYRGQRSSVRITVRHKFAHPLFEVGIVFHDKGPSPSPCPKVLLLL